MTLKTCRCCGKTLSLDSFHKDRALSDGHRNICKTCACQRSRTCNKRLNDKTHGLRSVFLGMKKRCYYKNHVSYENYGGRGILICDEWLNNPETFYGWALSHGFKKGLQIDRIDNNGIYSPGNCRFVSASRNQQNRRDNVIDSELLSIVRQLYSRGMKECEINQWISKNTYKGQKMNRGDLSRICRMVTWKN